MSSPRLRTTAALITILLVGCSDSAGGGASATTTGDATGDATSSTGDASTAAPTSGPDTTATSAGSTSTTDPLTSTTSSTTDPATTDPATTQQPAGCGDGTLDRGEACDDGNLVDGDGCSATCQFEPPPTCGNGEVDPGEECDGASGCDAPTCTWQFRYVFFSTYIFSGEEVGGLDHADEICNIIASQPVKLRDRPFRAWLSGGSDQQPIHARDRIGKSSVPYRRTDDVVVAQSSDHLISGALDNPIDRNELGFPIEPDTPVWTGTLADGTRSPGDTQCGNWLTDAGLGRIGRAGAVDHQWTDTGMNLACSTDVRIYCIQSSD